VIIPFRNLWPGRRASIIAAAVYRIDCPCGGELTGSRLARHQVVKCPRCQRQRFVLPCSPFPAVETATSSSVPPMVTPLARRFWLLPVGAALLTGMLLWILGTLFLAHSTQQADHRPRPDDVSPAERLTRVEASMRQGHFRLAAQEFEAASQSFLKSASPRERHRWTQLGREASVYADLLAEPIEVLLEHALHTSEEEWLAEFTARYRGRAVLFDAHVWRDASGVRTDYEAVVGEKVAQLVLDELDFVKQIERGDAVRVIFAARLAGIKREPPGPRWVVRFQPGSDVLLTDATAAALCCPPLAEADSLEVLRRQRK